MKIWKLEVDMQDYESFQLSPRGNEFLRDFRERMSCGIPQNGKFDNLEIEVVDRGRISDSPKFWSFSGTLLLSEKAKMRLEEFLMDYVEFIPLKSKGAIYYLVNILSIVDGIDYEKTVLRKLSTGLIVGIEKYAFNLEKIKDIKLFKVLLNKRVFYTEIYVSNELKKIIEGELVGFKFVEVWDSGD